MRIFARPLLTLTLLAALLAPGASVAEDDAEGAAAANACHGNLLLLEVATELYMMETTIAEETALPAPLLFEKEYLKQPLECPKGAEYSIKVLVEDGKTRSEVFCMLHGKRIPRRTSQIAPPVKVGEPQPAAEAGNDGADAPPEAKAKICEANLKTCRNAGEMFSIDNTVTAPMQMSVSDLKAKDYLKVELRCPNGADYVIDLGPDKETTATCPEHGTR